MYYRMKESRSRVYKFNNSEVCIVFGNILDSAADVIVSSDDTSISMGGGVSKAILIKGGEIVQIDARKKLPVNIGDVVVSTAGSLKQKYIFHCMSIDESVRFDIYNRSIITTTDVNRHIVGHSVNRCFELLQLLNISSIAIPVIGTGAAHIPFIDAVATMVDCISAFLCSTNKPYKVEIWVYAREDKHKPEIDEIYMFEKLASSEALSQNEELRHIREIKEKEKQMIANGEMPTGKISEKDKMEYKPVFISYSRKDKDKADEIINFLEAKGIECWIDRTGIFSGYDFKEVIVDAIDASKIVVFLSSENSNLSDNVIREIGIAAEQKKTIIPLLLDDSPLAKSIRYDISNIDRIEYKYQEEAQKKLLESIIYKLEISRHRIN